MKKLISLLHIHRFNQPILSQYISFGSRRIIYQCKYGCKKSQDVYRSFSKPFPMPTTNFVEDKDVKAVLNNPSVLPMIVTFEDRMKVGIV